MHKTVKAYAKINLTLDVKYKRDDGYHEIATVMQTVSLCDEVSVKKAPNISVSCSQSDVPIGEKNIAYKAASAFFEKAEAQGGAEIYIKKRIPMQAGLAGGSADAAAVLVALNSLYGDIFTKEYLCEIGAKIGADVPFCVSGGTKAAYSIGEKLIGAPKIPECKIVIVKPSVSINTAEAYKKIDSRSGESNNKTEAMLKALSDKNMLKIGENLSNDFESVCSFPELSYIKTEMNKFSAYGSLMSGSGSAVYGLFNFHTNDAEKCAESLKDKFPGSVFLCRPV